MIIMGTGLSVAEKEGVYWLIMTISIGGREIIGHGGCV